MPRGSADPNATGEEVLAGRYELHEPIGKGGMSTVYRARDRSLGRPVAVKLIRHAPAGHKELHELRERFRREAENAAHIPPHPNVVQIYDYGTDPERDLDFIVMELLRGRDLKAALGDQSFSTAEAVPILLEAARGLAAGHRAGIVHRDVKPANFLLVEKPTGALVKVLDFGIAKALQGSPEDDLTQDGNVPHTPAYASPEQLAGAHTLSPASDVYQLGLVAYELLTGERSFDAHDRERIGKGESVPLPARERWSEVPLPLRTVVERSLRVDPGERYPDAGAFAEALGAAQEDDHTVLALTAPEGVSAPVRSAPPTAESLRSGVASIQSRWRSLPREARLAVTVVLAVLLLWALFRGTGDSSAEAGSALEPLNAAELETEFAPLFQEASEWLEEMNRAERE